MPTYYVDKTGSDSQSGEPGSPFLTVAKGLSVLVPGDRLRVRPGVYTEAIASIANGVTVEQDPLTSGVVTLRPGAAARCFTLTGVSDIVFSNLSFDATNVTTDCGKITTGAQRITLADCELMNAPTGQGLLISSLETGFNQILRCSIHNNGSNDLQHQLYISTDSNNNLVEGCELYNGFGYGIHQYDGAGIQNNVYRRNLIHGLLGIGILLSSGSNNQASYNVIYDTGIAIQVSIGESASRVYNNTCASNDGGIHLENRVIPISGILIKNNICWGNLNFDFRNNESTTHTLQANLFGTFQPGEENMAGNLTGVDPLFRDLALLNLRLQSGSPAIDAGQNLGLTMDFVGNTVPFGAAPDMGAFEFGPPAAPTNLRVV